MSLPSCAIIITKHCRRQSRDHSIRHQRFTIGYVVQCVHGSILHRYGDMAPKMLDARKDGLSSASLLDAINFSRILLNNGNNDIGQ